MKSKQNTALNSLLYQFFIFDSIEKYHLSLQNNVHFQAFIHQPHFIILVHKQTKSITHQIDFNDYNCSNGHLLFIADTQFRTINFDALTDFEVILFSYDFLKTYYPNASMLSFNPLFNYSIYSPILPTQPHEFNHLQNIVNQIKTEFNQYRDFATIPLLQSLLHIFLLQSERLRIQNLTQSIHSTYYKEFISLQELLKTNIFKERSVKAYATALFMSTKKLNMITQEIIQQPAKTFITNTLILSIKRKLANTTHSIKQIGLEVGFDEPTNFVKFFKKYEGITPAKFRATACK